MAWADVASSEADLYVNATPVGWRDEDPSAIPRGVFEGRPLVFDCVYRRDGRETSTIRAGAGGRMPDGRRAADAGLAGGSPGVPLRAPGRLVRRGQRHSAGRGGLVTSRDAERRRFLERAVPGSRVPVARTFPSDCLTPVMALPADARRGPRGVSARERRGRRVGRPLHLPRSRAVGPGHGARRRDGGRARRQDRDARRRSARDPRAAGAARALRSGSRAAAALGAARSDTWRTTRSGSSRRFRTGTRERPGCPTRSSCCSTPSWPSTIRGSASCC